MEFSSANQIHPSIIQLTKEPARWRRHKPNNRWCDVWAAEDLRTSTKDRHYPIGHIFTVICHDSRRFLLGLPHKSTKHVLYSLAILLRSWRNCHLVSAYVLFWRACDLHWPLERCALCRCNVDKWPCWKMNLRFIFQRWILNRFIFQHNWDSFRKISQKNI